MSRLPIKLPKRGSLTEKQYYEAVYSVLKDTSILTTGEKFGKYLSEKVFVDKLRTIRRVENRRNSLLGRKKVTVIQNVKDYLNKDIFIDPADRAKENVVKAMKEAKIFKKFQTTLLRGKGQRFQGFNIDKLTWDAENGVFWYDNKYVIGNFEDLYHDIENQHGIYKSIKDYKNDQNALFYY